MVMPSDFIVYYIGNQKFFGNSCVVFSATALGLAVFLTKVLISFYIQIGMSVRYGGWTLNFT